MISPRFFRKRFILGALTLTVLLTFVSSKNFQDKSFIRSKRQKLNVFKNTKQASYENNEIAQVNDNEIKSVVDESSSTVWTFKCKDNVGCVRELRNKNQEPVEIEVCWLTCGKYGPLWPYPTGKITLSQCLVAFNLEGISFDQLSTRNSESEEILKNMRDKLMLRLKKMIPLDSLGKNTQVLGSNNKVSIQISISQDTAQLGLGTDESYSLVLSSDEASCKKQTPLQLNIIIKAATIFGARHALETASQLMAYDVGKNYFQMVSNAEIVDAPEFPYRGTLVDTARNFIPIPDLKRMIDAMSYNKLNMLHWHITDSNSFGFFSKRVPKMTQYGAYSNSEIYFPKDIEELIQYATVSGVKIIPELDAPAHAGNGWQWGRDEGLGDLALCVNLEPWRAYCGQPPCGQLNPTNPNTYIVLEKIYKDLLEVFDQDLFHCGGDEVYNQCWQTEPLISSWIGSGKNLNFMEIWGFFQDEAFKRLKKANKGKPIRPIVWTSGMTASSEGRRFLNASEYIIQVWEDGNNPVIKTLINEKYQLIISNVDSMYLDMGAGTWLGTQHVYSYKVWQVQYDNHLSKFMHNIEEDKKKPISERQILGAEAALWSEKVNPENMDTKMWPRASATAENLWSDPNSRSPMVYSRLNHHNRRMIQLGIHSDQLQPLSCYLISGHCDDPQSSI